MKQSVSLIGLVFALGMGGCALLPRSLNWSQQPEPSVSPTSTTVNVSFRKAVNLATDAAQLAQSASTQADWQKVVETWQQAIQLMQAVPSASPQYRLARQKETEYQANLKIAQGKAKSATIAPTTKVSTKQVDYRKLQAALAKADWRQANLETSELLFKISGWKPDQWSNQDPLREFPCTELQNIDHLWMRYSQGHFGFTTQRQILRGLSLNSEALKNRESQFEFGTRVGWRTRDQWISASDIVYDQTAPEGHLPCVACSNPEFIFDLIGAPSIGARIFSYIAPRMEQCKLKVPSP